MWAPQTFGGVTVYKIESPNVEEDCEIFKPAMLCEVFISISNKTSFHCVQIYCHRQMFRGFPTRSG